MKAFTLMEILIVVLILGILAYAMRHGPPKSPADVPEYRLMQVTPNGELSPITRAISDHPSQTPTLPMDSSQLLLTNKGITIQIWLSIGVLVTFIFSLVIEATVSLRVEKCRNPDFIVKVFGLTIAAFGAIFLIVAGYSRDQIMPALAVLGTLAGYCFGKEASSHSIGHTSSYT